MGRSTTRRLSPCTCSPPVRRAWTPVPVGRVFAKLCGREGSRLYAKMGSGLCLFYYDCMKQAIEKTEFVQ